MRIINFPDNPTILSNGLAVDEQMLAVVVLIESNVDFVFVIFTRRDDHKMHVNRILICNKSIFCIQSANLLVNPSARVRIDAGLVFTACIGFYHWDVRMSEDDNPNVGGGGLEISYIRLFVDERG